MSRPRRINEFGEIIRDAAEPAPPPTRDWQRTPDVRRPEYRPRPPAGPSVGGIVALVLLVVAVGAGALFYLARLGAKKRMANVAQPVMVQQANFNQPPPDFAFDKTKKGQPINPAGIEQADRDFALGDDYRLGHGVAMNLPKAFELYKKAADAGHVNGQHNVGWMYENGLGVQRDTAETMRWYRQAADQGHVEAQHGVGYLAQHGYGAVAPDYAEAMRWYQRAAAQNLAASQTAIGVLYHNGHGVPQDYAKALQWYRKGTDQNNADAQFNTGLLYEYGLGVNKDAQAAVGWYRKASAQGQQGAAAGLVRLGAK